MKTGEDRSIGSEWWNALTPEKQDNVLRARRKLVEYCKTHTINHGHNGGAKRKVRLIDAEGNVTTMESVKAAAKFLGVSKEGITKQLKKNEREYNAFRNSAIMCKGYKVYYDDDLNWLKNKRKLAYGTYQY